MRDVKFIDIPKFIMLYPGAKNSTVYFENYSYCHIIAEIGLNHNGSIEIAKECIKRAVLAGCTYVKIQKRSPLDLTVRSTLINQFDKCPAFGSNQLQIRERHEFSEEQYLDLTSYADNYGALLFTSVFDIPSLEFALKCDCKLIKIASHSNTNSQLLKEINKYKLPCIMSTGGASIEEIDTAVSLLSDCDLSLMHCVSSYPTPSSLSSLSTIPFLNQRYSIPVGFSSHEDGISQSIASVALGACMIERHVTLSKTMEGLDHKISLNFEELSSLRGHINNIVGTLNTKKEVFIEEHSARFNYHVGVYATKDLEKGEILKIGENIILKQPAGDFRINLTGLDLENRNKKDIVSKVNIKKDSIIQKSQVLDTH